MASWYPNALDGQRQVPDVTYINVRHFRDQIEQAATLLEAIDCELGALNDIKSDWLRSLAVACKSQCSARSRVSTIDIGRVDWPAPSYTRQSLLVSRSF